MSAVSVEPTWTELDLEEAVIRLRRNDSTLTKLKVKHTAESCHAHHLEIPDDTYVAWFMQRQIRPVSMT
eukprot:scaffold404991_cov19-Prasinocladus_malaysianus.AAC.1